MMIPRPTYRRAVETALKRSPVCAVWEGFALEQILRISRAPEAYFWGTQSGAELDLLLLRGGRRIGYEFKYSERPASVTRSMRVACEDLRLDRLWIVCPGNARTKLDAAIEVCGIDTLNSASTPLLD